jgi:hypothetical protein
MRLLLLHYYYGLVKKKTHTTGSMRARRADLHNLGGLSGSLRPHTLVASGLRPHTLVA